MHARVATFEGGSADEVRRTVARIGEQSQSGPPEGVPAVGFLLLQKPEEGRVLAIGLFDSEEDLKKGHEALDALDPPEGGMGRRTSVEMYEVGVKVDL